jgi:predicted nucleic acid-binding protein
VVLNASITLAWAFQEADPTAREARQRLRHEDAVVPSLWWFEARNGLTMGEHRRLLTEQRTGRFLRDLARVAIIVDRIPDEPAVLTLARHRRLTVYDAAYPELGRRAGLIEPILCTVCQYRRVENNAANLDPTRFLVGHTLIGALGYLHFGSARDVCYSGGR